MSHPSIQPLVPRADFPIFQTHPTLSYLDSAATTQRPQVVLNAEQAFTTTANANVHRGLYRLAEQATAQFEAARATVARFVGGQPAELVVTSGATAAINLVAQSFVQPKLTQRHQIITTIAEHHSNFVPWQQLARVTGSTLRVLPVSSGGQLDLTELDIALKERPTAIVAVADVGNVLGTVNPTTKIVELAHARGAPVLVDAAQSLAHLPISVQRLDADFLVGSAHKAYGPTGVGFLWAKREHLEAMPPTQFGSEMIRSVRIDETTWNTVPWRFDAGTPPSAPLVGFAAALDFRNNLGWEPIAAHEEQLLEYADERLRAINGLAILGPANPRDRAGLISFTVAQVHPHDLATLLDDRSVAVRAGFHCAEPLHRSLGLDWGSVRASVGVYTDSNDIDSLINTLSDARTAVSTTLDRN
jgi:cysteine desulfurase/selenocysteine lyase